MQQMNQMHCFQADVSSDKQINLNPVQWNQALGMARKLCADIFQEGGGPQDAVRVFGKVSAADEASHWGHAINLIAFTVCMPPREPLQ